MKLRELFEVYRKRKLRVCNPRTPRNFRYAIAHFERFIGKAATLDDLTDDNVSDMMAFRVQVDGCEAGTVNSDRKKLLALWRFACRSNLKDDWPDVEGLPEPERIPVAWTQGQLAKLFDACESQAGFIADVPANLWWHGLHCVFWDTGERAGAVLQIERADVDLDDRWLIVRGETRKGKTRDKAFRLHADTVEVLRRMWEPKRKSLFPWPYSYTYLWTVYGRMLESAGLPNDRRHKFHCMRKSVASYFEAVGGNATDLLDHSRRDVTKLYLDPRIVKKPQASEMLFRPKAG